ncbi:MAG: NAD(P)/FAD-dependent oxidoreductase [Polyangiales bacterium]
MAPRTAIVLGAGPSGLATSACLRRRGVRVTTLEARDAVGSSWRRHYRRLHLHTVKEHSALPGMPFGDEVARYPSRADVVAYLDAYAARFGVTPVFGQRARDARRAEGRWVVTTDDARHEADALVVATGYNRAPVIPTWPGREGFGGEVIHASQYLDGAPFRGRSVLVVGVGNTGAELALDLWEHGARVALCARSPQHVVPRDVLGVPAQVNSLYFMRHLPLPLADALARRLSRMIFGDLARWGLPAPTTGMLSDVVKRGHIPMLDIGTVALIKQGAITVVPGIERFEAGRVCFVDGRALPFDAVVLATGYRAALTDVLADAAEVTDARGYPRWHGEPVPGFPGLYFVGYRNPLTGALHDIARESERVAAHIAGAT